MLAARSRRAGLSRSQGALTRIVEAQRRAYSSATPVVLKEDGRRLVVDHSYHRPREIMTATGRAAVQARRVDDHRRGMCTAPPLPPLCMRGSPRVSEVLLSSPSGRTHSLAGAPTVVADALTIAAVSSGSARS